MNDAAVLERPETSLRIGPKRNHRIDICVSADEKRRLAAEARQTGEASVSALIRRRVFGSTAEATVRP